MNISVDISMYPLKGDFEPSIIDFIKKVRTLGLHVEENGLSTQVFGPFDQLMPLMTQEIKTALSKEDNCVFVLKIVTGERKEHVPTF